MSSETATVRKASVSIDLEALQNELSGRVIGPADADYEAARKVHNGMIDKHPAVSARCTGMLT
jgi:hypothetical protein